MQKSIYSGGQQQLQSLLRDLRKQKGFRQKDLADILDVPQSFISKYEVGERRLDVLEARMICHAIGVDFSDFVKQLERRINES